MKNKNMKFFICYLIFIQLLSACQNKDIKQYFYSEKNPKIWKTDMNNTYFIYSKDGRLDIAKVRAIDSSLVSYNIYKNDTNSINSINNKWHLGGDTLFEGTDTFLPVYKNNALRFTKNGESFIDVTDCFDINGEKINSKSRVNEKGFNMLYDQELKNDLSWKIKTIMSRDKFNQYFLNPPEDDVSIEQRLLFNKCDTEFARARKKNKRISTIKCGD
jgi:hypothetical protein